MASTLKGRLECPNKDVCANANVCSIANQCNVTRITSLKPELSFYGGGVICNSYAPDYTSFMVNMALEGLILPPVRNNPKIRESSEEIKKYHLSDIIKK